MQKFKQGFTLMELMVTVAIIGVLSSVVIPAFKNYQAKSRQSEAKLSMAFIVRLEESWKAQYDAYATCLSTMGFSREVGDTSYYSIGFNYPVGDAANASTFNTPSVDAGAPSECTVGGPNTQWTPSTPAAIAHWYQGNRAVQQANAPTLGEFSTYVGITGILDTNAQSFTLGSYGYVEQSIAWQPSLLMNSAIASDDGNNNGGGFIWNSLNGVLEVIQSQNNPWNKDIYNLSTEALAAAQASLGVPSSEPEPPVLGSKDENQSSGGGSSTTGTTVGGNTGTIGGHASLGSP
jgi:prepilin-type N-terminal cleavage/methylation domain-containing protein